MNIINSSVFMKSQPTETSLLETECLFGESVQILDKFSDWVYCKLKTDNYYGWIKKKGLGKLNKSTHRVITNRTFIFSDPNPKSQCLFYLPLGAKLPVENKQSEWSKVSLYNNYKPFGYVPSRHLVSINHKVNDWVAIAEQLVGTPYKWGGRDTVGLDCSALLQLSYQTYGENIPRNTSEQVKIKKNYIEGLRNLKRGCVIFWRGHVGIMIDNSNCIHANAYHMQTNIEPLSKIVSRMEKDFHIIAMMDFN